MYIPDAFRVADSGVLENFLRTYAFATIVSHTEDGLLATHVPLLFDRQGEGDVLLGHMARANPHWRHFDDDRQIMVIFHGPHGYVSPSWYATSQAVPTWNYAVAHVYGRPEVIEDPSRVRSLLERLVARYESSMRAPWSTAQVAPAYLEQLAKAIVAFSISVERIEGNFKLGQNRSRADIDGVIAGLTEEGGSDGRALAEFTRHLLANEVADGAAPAVAPMGPIALVDVWQTPAAREFFRNVWPMYVHETSAFGTDFYTLDQTGGWVPDIVHDWISSVTPRQNLRIAASEHDPAQPFQRAHVIASAGRPVGFICVGLRPFQYMPDDADASIAEFFLIHEARGSGAAVRALELVLCRYPGRWHLRVIHDNARALRFWRKTLPLVGIKDIEERRGTGDVIFRFGAG